MSEHKQGAQFMQFSWFENELTKHVEEKNKYWTVLKNFLSFIALIKSVK